MNSTNSTPALTTFMTLPTRIQLDIMKLLDSEARRNLRLTCTELFHLVNSLGKPGYHKIGDYIPGSFENLVNSTYTSIESLGFSFLSKPLPIYSSTRILIPRTNRLVIGPRVSTENKLNLIRYYAKDCIELEMYMASLPFMKPIYMYGSSNCLANVRKFTISVWVYPHNNEISEQICMNGLGQFFKWINMPSLNTFGFKKQWMMLTHHISYYGNFCKSFINFLMKHGKQLKSVQFTSVGLLSWPSLLNTLEYLANVRDLLLHDFTYHDEEGNMELIKKGFGNFTKLHSLDICFNREIQEELAVYLLKNNEATIKSLNSNLLWSLTWLYRNFRNANNFMLRSLTFNIRFDGPAKFESAYELNFKLDHLSQLSVEIYSNEDMDWRDTFIKWITLVMPNLKALNLYYAGWPFIKPRVGDFVALISSLPLFTTFTFGTLDIFTEKDPTEAVSDEVRNWINQNPNLRTTWSERRNGEERTLDYQIHITRPYIHQIES